MNIAIILAVSKYKIPGNDLIASKKDGKIINDILSATKKYDDILYLNDNETSLEIKELIGNFFIKHKDKSINELFFYYSGHGEFSNDKFYYLLSDYDEKRKHQTTLQNEEIDHYIRNLSPELVVKVVDSCQSGARYIKDFEMIPKYIAKSKEGFKNCYFLYSSLSDQYSYQDDNLSFFTKSFIESIKLYPSDEISYKHIIEFINDEFQNIGEQNPFYVIQAEMTEKFCKYNNEFRSFLEQLNLSDKSTTAEENEKKRISLFEIVKNDAKEYVDKEGAIKAMHFSEKHFKKVTFDNDLSELYDVKTIFSNDNNSIEGIKAVGKWLIENSHDYFARPEFEWLFDSEAGPVIGYEFLVDGAPYNSIVIEILSKFPNVKSYKCNVAILVSKKEISFFYSLLKYVDSGWDSKELESTKISWKYNIAKIADNNAIKIAIESIYNFLNKEIRSEIENHFGYDLL